MKDNFNGVVVGESTQHISVQITHAYLPYPITLSFVHAYCTGPDRRVLWNGLLNDKPGLGTWLVGGDLM